MDRNSVRPLDELLDSVRDIDGFPIGKDEDILALSDPPYYTACPNPYIKQFIEEYGKPYDPENDDYERTPYVGDVSEGKNDPIYNAHSYHTKVPYRAIIPFIEHYTEPGDIIFDGFCGTGMTGIATQMTGRRAVMVDLSPAATFIAYNYNTVVDSNDLINVAKYILKQLENECDWLYVVPGKYGDKNIINYIIWSEVFECPYCNGQLKYWDIAVDDQQRLLDEIESCPLCGANISKKELIREKDETGKGLVVPVYINLKSSRERYSQSITQELEILLKEIDTNEIPYWYPSTKMLFKGAEWGDTWRAGYHSGYERVSDFYFKRTLWALASLRSKIDDIEDILLSKRLLYLLTSVCFAATKLYKYRTSGGGQPAGNNLYIPSLIKEQNVLQMLHRKLQHIQKAENMKRFSEESFCLSTSSTTDLPFIPDNSIDYIFVDPPFGSNIMYSESNFIWESWLKVYTNKEREAIINQTQQKHLAEYRNLMLKSFSEMYRILKPNRWFTLEFHNSKASVWNSIQEALAKTGFIIAQVAILDKKQRTFKQVTSPGAVEKDLVINAYKPKKEFSERFLKNAGEGMEVDFVTQQLEHLPVGPNIERTEKMLYSKMLSHYVENGFRIRYDATTFYKLLSDNFTELDGYWFLDHQVKEYNEWKSGLSLDQIKEVIDGQRVLFVSDEKSALTWLYQFLHQPRSYSDIFTAYQQVATTTDDEVPELREVLDNNFIFEDGNYRRPLSRDEKESINQNRERELDRAFNKLLQQARKQKGKIRAVRREALVHGFTKCYQEGRYKDILTIADKLYASTLESSGDIMDFVDIARIKTSGEKKIEDY